MARKTRKKKAGKQNPAFPTRKISETLLEFADPLVTGVLDEGGGIEQVQTCLEVATTIWNALVLEATGDSSFIEEARRMLAPLRTSSGASPLEVLVRRKRTHFANDLRLVGPWHLYPDGDDGFRLQATALAPPTLR